MFNNPNKNTSPSENTREQNRISAGTVITGDIVAKGGFRIEGSIKGSLTTKGKVVISKGGLLEGILKCNTADFEGSFSGKLFVTETLTLRSSAIVDGEVTAGKLAIEPGATFNATCEMNGVVKTLNHDKKQKERTA